MKYTPTLNGDLIVADYLDQIKEAANQGSFKSLVLFGSYGRGEGAIIEGKPRNDFDLLLVDGNDRCKRALADLDIDCEVEVHALTSDMVKEAEPTQQWWEIKYSSQLLDGKPLHLPAWEAYEIPYADALNSLNRRCVSMLIGKHELMKEEPDYRKAAEQAIKMIIAVGDAMLIKRGKFHPSYAHRSLMLMQDEVGDLYQVAVAVKIYGQPELNPDQVWQLWMDARRIFRKYITINQLNVELANVLLSISDRTSKEQLEQVIKELGGERWL